MLAKILGYFFILMGIFFLIKPEILRKRFLKKITKRIKKYLFSVAIFLGILFIGAAFKSSGFLSKLLMVLGIISIFKGFFFLKAKVAEKIITWIAQRPPVFFRFAASIYILIGLLILLG